MPHLPALISDLALILVLAGFVSLLFKKLRQPLVLGYIVAGFLAGKHMPYMPSVADTSSVETWSQLGVVFLMFTLGLEFSFKKIMRQGVRPPLTAILVMYCMLALGNGVGLLFGWSSMDCLFLGGMLAMSSTTIIFKALGDLGLMQSKFAPKVLSVLVLEDILGILLMVILSGVAVSQKLEGGALVSSLLDLGFLLVLWFVVGMFVIPTFLRLTKRMMNAETLLIFSVACCFLLVVYADAVGYSTALGAFMMGSIFAETVEAERISRIVSPVKDLFGAIFFVSVGMLVDPAILVEYWLPILVITLSILLGQAVLGSLSFLLTGHSLKMSVQCGFTLAQVGEFAFIIASMGISMGVTGRFLYPVIVAVSIITTFLTPYMIRAAQHMVLPAVTLRLPAKLRKDNTPSGPWRRLLTALAIQVSVYFVLAYTTILVVGSPVLVVARGLFGHWPGNIMAGVLATLAASPFIRPIVMRKNHSEEWKTIARLGRGSRTLLNVTLVLRFLIAVMLIYSVFDYLSPYRYYWHLLASAIVVLLICASRRIKLVSRRLEEMFRRNLAAREEALPGSEAELDAFARLMSDGDEAGEAPIQLRHIAVRSVHPFCGKSLRSSRLREDFGCQVVGMEQGDAGLNMPDADYIIKEGDTLWLVGNKSNLWKLIMKR